ncbi:acyl-protein synthetase [Aliarcobacter cryaerophilus]|uniref:LuxE/PaaK family acyltransferase n=1 Tax=Aliarcobacter TaxID=2321111 RepID=UPI0029B6A9AF|nr:acyl-protein synthetase [Aliarcobacter skirrowii]MDX4050855.1 acyl-protein synthetase [Aliarcobacter skirrowii]
MEINEYLEKYPYELESIQKNKYLVEKLNNLILYHYDNSKEYKNIIDSFSLKDKLYTKLEEMPFLPVRLFKNYELKSCKDDQIFKVLTSSGTTSQKVSKIFLDKENASNQTKVLIKIMQTYLGRERLPMLIIDSKSILKDRSMFSARGAGILGLSNFGRDHTYLLDDNMEIDFDILNDFINKYKNKKIFIFGFTFMIWQYFYEQLKSKNIFLNLENAILIHSGGWKKLVDKSVDNDTFKSSLEYQAGIKIIHDFYGMVEQVGSIFVECEYGHLHTPIFSDVIIRNPITLQPLPFGEKGLIEVLSVLPSSYPGHILLTEDIGTIIGEDNCKCGKKGKYFRVHGRLPKSEIRGCSDTHAFDKG